MRKISFEEALEEILAKDKRYDEHAYIFIREALDYTIKLFNKPTEGPERHVSGKELLQGIKKFALQEYGPMTLTVLNRWGVHETLDFGELVFNLVETGILGKTDQDHREDFANGYDFTEAFRNPFTPTTQAQNAEQASAEENNRNECV